MKRALIIAACLAALPAAPARAHDSLAPPGASHNWLPQEEWVHRQWVPFDEQQLKTELGLHGRDLQAYLYDDHHTFADLARRRGVDVPALADRLVAPWPPADRPRLRERTLRILTQGHLAQHLLFHVFHGLELGPLSHHVFGMPKPAYRALRETGASYAEIAERGGMPVAAVRDAVVALSTADRDDGIARHEAWPPEAERILARTLAWLPCWVQRPPPRLDPANPYGKNRFLHGDHVAGWPATARERAQDERRVERFRRRLQPSCWSHPPRWRAQA